MSGVGGIRGVVVGRSVDMPTAATGGGGRGGLGSGAGWTARIQRAARATARGVCRVARPRGSASPLDSGDSMAQRDTDAIHLRAALEAAQAAGRAGETPVGAVVVVGGLVVAAAGNRVERDCDPTAHAEIVALRAACAAAGSWRLGPGAPGADNGALPTSSSLASAADLAPDPAVKDVVVYASLEPCPMCREALSRARVRRVVWAAPRTVDGAGVGVGVVGTGEWRPRGNDRDVPSAAAVERQRARARGRRADRAAGLVSGAGSDCGASAEDLLALHSVVRTRTTVVDGDFDAGPLSGLAAASSELLRSTFAAARERGGGGGEERGGKGTRHSTLEPPVGLACSRARP